MDKNMDLLPWILGGLSMVAVAIAIAVGSSNRTTPNLAQAPTEVAAHALPEAVAIDTPAPSTPVLPATSDVPGTPPAPAPAVVAAQIQPATPSMVPSGQIWECTTNGQRTFSNKPCGDKSSVRELSPINIMNPTPILSAARTYAPESNYATEDPYPTQEVADSQYPMLVGIPYVVRMKPERTHRPTKHDRGPSPRIAVNH
jgi:hypothetical protein